MAEEQHGGGGKFFELFSYCFYFEVKAVSFVFSQRGEGSLSFRQ